MESSEMMHNNSLVERGLRALREYSQKRIFNSLIVLRLLERSELGVKAKTLAALGNNIMQKKV